MSKIQDVPFITKVIDTLSDELKSGLYDLIDGQVKTPIFRSLVNNDYAITEANDKGKVQFVTLETLRGNYTGYLAYNSVYCVLIAFKGNTQALDMLNINVAKHTFAFVNESLSILELRVELEDGKKGVTPTDLGVTNNNIHLAKGTTQIGEGINVKTINGETLLGSGNIVVGEGGTITIDTALDDTSTNAVQNKVVTEEFEEVEDKIDGLESSYVSVYGDKLSQTTIENKKVSPNTQYQLFQFDTNTNFTVIKVHLNKGEKVMVVACAQNSVTLPVLIASEEDVTSGSPAYFDVVYGTNSSTTLEEKEYVATKDCYIYINSRTDRTACGAYVLKNIISKTTNNHWFGKKITFIGTSVDFGSDSETSFAFLSSKALGFTLINASVPGEAIHTNNDGTPLTYGSTCLSISEYASNSITIESNPITPYYPNGMYNNYYRTWENALNNDSDLYIFDVLPNNNNWSLSDWEAFDKDEWKYSDDSAFDVHRTTFLGALIYLIDKLYTINPNARIVFVVSSNFNYSQGLPELKTFAEYYHIPLIDLWGKMNITKMSARVINYSGVVDGHPSTFGHKKLADMFIGEILSIA